MFLLVEGLALMPMAADIYYIYIGYIYPDISGWWLLKAGLVTAIS